MSNSNLSTSALQRPTAAFSGVLLATLLASGAALAAVGTPPSVIAMSQKLKGDAVSITYAYMPKNGTLDIFAVGSSGKAARTPLGKVALTKGDHRDISVDLSSAPKPGTKLEAVLETSHAKPFTDAGEPARQSFKIL
jgi:hypothetical protein